MNQREKKDLNVILERMDQADKDREQIHSDIKFIKENLFNPHEGLWTETKQNTQFRENSSKWRGVMGTGVIGLFLKQKENNQPMTIVGKVEQTRDFTHVSDVVAANIAAMQTELGGGEVYNVGTGTSYTILEIASIIGGNYTFIPERPGECRYISADNSKINNKLNWQPTVNLRNWINNYKTKTI